MEIGTIGAGAFAQAFAKRALKAGHKVKLSNSRGPDSLRSSKQAALSPAEIFWREENISNESHSSHGLR
jgi:predicted dinucleotide-binding enzyme